MDFNGWNVGDILTLAKLASAAYLLDSEPAVTALGMTYLGQPGTPECQATICSWKGWSVVAVRGTQVTGSEVSVPELLDDIDFTPIAIPGGSRVATGPFFPFMNLWGSIGPLMGPGKPLFVGHSLGGIRAHYGPFFRPGADVVSFGAIKGADNAFWTYIYPGNPPLRIVHEDDFAPGWPWDGPWGQPSDLAWLHAGTLAVVPKRPGLDVSISDHFIDTGYIPAIEALPL